MIFFIMTTRERTEHKHFCFHKETKKTLEKIPGGENIVYSCHLVYIDRKQKQPVNAVDSMLEENIKPAA